MSVCNANTKEELENKDSHQALFSFEGTTSMILRENCAGCAFAASELYYVYVSLQKRARWAI